MVARGRGLFVAACLSTLACRTGDSAPGAAAEPTAAGAPDPATNAQVGEAAPVDQAEQMPPLPDHAVVDDEIRAAQHLAQRQVLPQNAELLPDLQPTPKGPLPGLELPADPMPGFFAPLEMPPQGDPLARFETALADLEAGRRQQPVRLAIYGASGTAIDYWTGYLRRYLQARFGDGGPGIASAAPHNRWYRHHELSIKGSKHWTKRNAYRRDGETDPGYFGPLGVCHDTDHKRAWCEIGPSRSAPEERALAFYEVLHLQQPGGGSYRVLLDGKKVATVSTKLDEGKPQLGTHRLDLQAGQPTLRIEVAGDGPVRMLGVIAETSRPGVVVDTLAMDGARITNQLFWDEALWAASIQRREPVLYALAFGTNSSVNEDEPLADWEDGYRTVLERFRDTLPDAGCLVLGPGDYPIVEGGEILPRPRLAEIRSIERRLASEFGCAYYDALTFAGGEGAKKAWVEAGLARDDYLHLTRAGYVRFGMGFADALMQRYDWRKKHATAQAG